MAKGNIPRGIHLEQESKQPQKSIDDYYIIQIAVDKNTGIADFVQHPNSWEEPKVFMALSDLLSMMQARRSADLFKMYMDEEINNNLDDALEGIGDGE